MDLVFQGCAAIGGTIIVLQFLISIVGMGDDHGDASGHDGMDTSPDHDGPADDHASTWIFGVVTIRTVAAGLAFFGLAGMAARKADVHIVGVVFLSTVAGLGAFYLMSWLTRFLSSLNVDGTVNIHQALECDAKVYVAIPGGRQGAGKVHVEVAGRTLEYQAKTPGEPLPTGTEVRVVDILAANMVEVVRITDASAREPAAKPPVAGGGEFKSLNPQE